MAVSLTIHASEATTYVLAISCEQMKNAEDYLREFVLAWLDTEMNDGKAAFDVSLGLLRTVQQVMTFNDGRKCYEYLSKATEKRGFLVLSYQIDDQLLNDFIALPQLEYIYIFGKDCIYRKEHEKLVEITSIEALYSRLSQDAPSSIEADDDTDFATLKSSKTVNSIRDLEGDARLFVFYQLLIEILLHLPKTEELRKQFVTFCMEKTSDNTAQQTIFQQWMENYKPDEAISWYTNPCFFHKLLNRTCRLGNIQDMFKLAFYMVDLNTQLKNIHIEDFDYYPDRIEVYRGRPMSHIEYNKLKSSIGDLVVTKSFLSTTLKEDVARMYSGADTKKPDFVPAILYMIVDKRTNETKPFAYTCYHSKVRADDEILISMGTIFRIVEANDKNGVQEFKLIRGDEEEKVEQDMHATFRDQMKTNDQFFHSESSANIDECCKQVLDVLTSPLVQPAYSNTVEQAKSGSESIQIKTVKSCSLPRGRLKRIYREVEKLKLEVKDIFILELAPSLDDDDDDDDDTMPKWRDSDGNIFIEGRILPRLEPYCQRSFRIRIVLCTDYPFTPPILTFMDYMYHPNISNRGRMCNRMLNKYDSYKCAISIANIIIDVEEQISDFKRDLVINLDACKQYENDPEEFNKTALEYIYRYGHPRS